MTTLSIYLALAMWGEAAILHSGPADIAVAHVFLNRLQSGALPGEVLSDFHGARYLKQEDVPQSYMDLAHLITMGHTADPTNGSLYILSWQDLKRLWPTRAETIARHAEWISEHRFIDGELYRLYAFRCWPEQRWEYLKLSVTYVIPQTDRPYSIAR